MLTSKKWSLNSQTLIFKQLSFLIESSPDKNSKKKKKEYNKVQVNSCVYRAFVVHI